MWGSFEDCTHYDMERPFLHWYIGLIAPQQIVARLIWAFPLSKDWRKRAEGYS